MSVRAFKFMPIADKLGYDSGYIGVVNVCALSRIKMLGFASIDLEKGTIIQDALSPADDKPMLLMKAKPHKGATFHILTDGDRYYPIKGQTKLVYSPGVIDMHGPLSEVDQLLIAQAVKYYTSLFD